MKAMRAFVSLAAALLTLCLASAPALAQNAGKSKDRRPRGVITLAEVTITGRIQKPIAAVDVTRLRPKLALAERSQPFLDRIEKAVYTAPF